MNKKLIGLLVCLLIAQFCISQNGYPKLTLIDNDTLVLFTPSQVNKMNKTYLDLDKSKAFNVSLREELNLFKISDSLCEEKNNALNNVNKTLIKIGEEKQMQIGLFTEENKKQQKRINLLKKSRTLFTIGGLVVGSISTYFIVQQFN